MSQYIEISGIKFPTTDTPEFPYLYCNNNYSNLEEADNLDYNLSFNNKYYKKKSINKMINFSTTYKMMDLYPDTYQTVETIDMLEVEKDYPGILTKLTTTYEMFRNCNNLTKILNIDKIDTSNVTNMNYTFFHCPKLKELDLSNWNTNNVTSMYCMFDQCYIIEKINISSFNTNNVTRMESMFEGCQKLTSIKFGVYFTTENVKQMNQMFGYCEKIGSTCPITIDCSSVTDKYGIHYMFHHSSITNVTLTNVNKKFTGINSNWLKYEKDNTLSVTIIN